MRTKMAMILGIVSERDVYASGCADGHDYDENEQNRAVGHDVDGDDGDDADIED